MQISLQFDDFFCQNKIIISGRFQILIINVTENEKNRERLFTFQLSILDLISIWRFFETFHDFLMILQFWIFCKKTPSNCFSNVNKVSRFFQYWNFHFLLKSSNWRGILTLLRDRKEKFDELCFIILNFVLISGMQ